jgi:hypothetical protein
MSALDRVRAKYKSAIRGTDRTDKSPSVSSVGPQNEQIESNGSTLIALDPAVTRRAMERIERRRAALLARLEANPDTPRVWLTDDKGDREYVILAIAIRDVGTCELSIPRDRYDPFKVLEIIGGVDAPR